MNVVLQETSLGDTVAEPIVLDSDGDGDGDVDIQTADDFVQGTEVEVRNAGSETWSPGRVHSAFGTNITVEVPVRAHSCTLLNQMVLYQVPSAKLYH